MIRFFRSHLRLVRFLMTLGVTLSSHLHWFQKADSIELIGFKIVALFLVFVLHMFAYSFVIKPTLFLSND